jgi:hypothetical protein
MHQDEYGGVPSCVKRGTVLGAVKAWPGNARRLRPDQARRPALTAPARGAPLTNL